MTRTRNPYPPKDPKPYKLSRSGIELFTECPRCFYLDKKVGISRPPGFPFNLNSAVDALLKKEFDSYREQKKPHPLMEKYQISAIPFAHENLEKWRHNFTGIQYLHEKSNLLIYGAVDDLWINEKQELIVVDYKSTSKSAEITELNEDWHMGYKRQMEVYQWLLRKNDFKVSSTCYWVYANGDRTKDRFDATLTFRMTVVPYTGNDSWIEPTIINIKSTLDNSTPPEASQDCDYCTYHHSRLEYSNGIK